MDKVEFEIRTGRIKSFDRGRGHGYIQIFNPPENGLTEVFVHVSE